MYINALSLPTSRQYRLTAGFTIVELITVIVILTVLAAIAAPNFTPMIERWRVRQASELLQSSVYLARSEAIKRGGAVITSLTGGTCSGWNCGWQVCADTNTDGTCDTGVPILQRYDAPNRLTISRIVGTGEIRVDSRGFFNSPASFSLVPEGKTLADWAALGVCVNASGIVRVVTPQSGGISCS